MTGKEFYSLHEGDRLKVTTAFERGGYKYYAGDTLEVVLNETKDGALYYYVKNLNKASIPSQCLGASYFLNYIEKINEKEKPTKPNEPIMPNEPKNPINPKVKNPYEKPDKIKWNPYEPYSIPYLHIETPHKDNIKGKVTSASVEDKEDGVNHPNHYNQGKIECIDALESAHGLQAVIDFCILNAHKYIWRCKDKGNILKDLEKAQWYINKAIELITKSIQQPPIDTKAQ